MFVVAVVVDHWICCLFCSVRNIALLIISGM